MTKHSTWTWPATWLLALTLFVGAGCGKKGGDAQPGDAGPAGEVEPAKAQCALDSDCPSNKVCYLERCVDTSSKADMLRQRGNVTPAKVRRELEKQTEERQQQLDRGLDMDE